jgi:hypothetical protein
MNRRKAATAIALAPLAAGQTKKSDIRSKFIGVWKLVSFESKDKGSGAVSYPYGAKPLGRLTYDGAGRMSFLAMSPGRRVIGGSPTRSPAVVIREASCDEMREILGGFGAYCGRFDIDEASRTVVHHVEISWLPSRIGVDQRRHFEFSGDNRLILTSVTDQSVGRLVWQREES